jgi:hypothetical protein
VFKAAVTGMAEVTEAILKRKCASRVTTCEWLVPHQANRRIIEAVAKRLGLDLKKVAINLDRYGNTVAGTIPLALSELNEQGPARARRPRRALVLRRRLYVGRHLPALGRSTGRRGGLHVRPTAVAGLGARPASPAM